jgi:opacity protein-like surface antigen
MNSRRIGIFVCSLLLTGGLSAQTFMGFAELGPNFNQIQGDDLAGWHKLGLYGGVGVMTDLSDRWRTSLLIGYSQFGSRASSRESQAGRLYDNVALNTVVVPIKIHYMDWLSEDELFYHLEFFAGVEYLRLVSERAESSDGTSLIEQNPYSPNGANALGGFYYAWSLNWAAGLSYRTSVFPAQAQSEEENQYLKQLALRLRRTF